MKLSKNPEVKRLLMIFAGIFILFIAIAMLMIYTSTWYYNKSVQYNNAAILGAIVEKYPDAETEIINQITSIDTGTAEIGQAILSKYGVDDENQLFLELDIVRRSLKVNLTLFLLLTILISSAFILLFIVFLKKLYSRITEVTKYAMNIQEGNYTLDIRDNCEGDISILKNEIYRITTMLKEQAESLEMDKVALANSIADISHQLKTPMTSMNMLNDLLANNPTEEMKIEFLNRIRSQLTRMEWLVVSLLKLSKLDAGTVIMKKDSINVKKLVEKALEAVSIPLDIKMQLVEVKGDGDLNIVGDFNWLCEAIINILKNSIEHTPENGLIQIEFEENPIYTIISISDNGAGIANEDIPYIFNRFYRGKNAREESVGIGLAMANTIIEKQGGNINVVSQQGKGTEFSIKFYKSVF
ncbi:sensor histidine kinase [Alkaliphilus peptidifermentans]|uniref:histidine kinase n=1 Tax=Alkaliphilus peptidifermentans DSM 18978 TaxID=1120976 RepID=A0A1G5CD04_9FIRM|nr:HAMP domain-containing sensor histidine kinase [Alkaliphilus peptidifermentans]SCY00236.1 Signal transduction histidine kinase [Alkaliphilus peptidifermentans DSM 18978]